MLRPYVCFSEDDLIRRMAALTGRGETAIVEHRHRHGPSYYALHRGKQVNVYGSAAAARRALSVREVAARWLGDRLDRAKRTAELKGWLGQDRRQRARMEAMAEAFGSRPGMGR